MGHMVVPVPVAQSLFLIDDGIPGHHWECRFAPTEKGEVCKGHIYGALQQARSVLRRLYGHPSACDHRTAQVYEQQQRQQQ